MTAPLVAAFGCGALFACGLAISGMTRPAKVLAFLDVGGAWDPSLALVMAAAVGTHALLRPFIMARSAPLLAPRFVVPTRHAVDWRLVAGGALFGVGWGLAGFCPGPAVTALGGGRLDAVWFAAAMVVGMALYRRVSGGG